MGGAVYRIYFVLLILYFCHGYQISPNQGSTNVDTSGGTNQQTELQFKFAAPGGCQSTNERIDEAMKQTQELKKIMIEGKQDADEQVRKLQQYLSGQTPDHRDSSAHSPKSCPDNWNAHGDSCYMFGNKPETWADALADCQRHRASLAMIETTQEDEYLRNTLLHLHPTNRSEIFYWIGATDKEKENEWRWSHHNERITGYTNWQPGEPDDDGDQNCMALEGVFGFLWDDNSCDERGYYICETTDH